MALNEERHTFVSRKAPWWLMTFHHPATITATCARTPMLNRSSSPVARPEKKRGTPGARRNDPARKSDPVNTAPAHRSSALRRLDPMASSTAPPASVPSAPATSEVSPKAVSATSGRRSRISRAAFGPGEQE